MMHALRSSAFLALVIGVVGCAHGRATEACEINVEVLSRNAEVVVKIDALQCRAADDHFLDRLKAALAAPGVSDKLSAAHHVSIVGPMGEDNYATLSDAWAAVCLLGPEEKASIKFGARYSATQVPTSVVKLFAANGAEIVFSGVDNFYVVDAGRKGAISNEKCSTALLPPVVWFRRVETGNRRGQESDQWGRDQWGRH